MVICNRFRLVPWSNHGRWLFMLLLSVFSAVVLTPAIAYADDPSFQKAIAFGHSEPTQSVAVGDFNGDGWLDIVQGNAGQSYLYLNDGQGRFITTVNLSATGNTLSVAVGDLNGDGWPDIVQGNDDQSYLYLNDGRGGLTVALKLGASSNAQSVAVGDLNGDGFLDIVQGNAGQSYLYLNDGQGRLTESITLGTGEATQSVAVGDFNGDGWLDIAQGNVGPSYLYLNDGQGHFSNRINLGNGEPAQRLTVGDLNGDGALDIIQGNAGQNHIALNDGQGHFPNRINLEAAEGANDVAQTASVAVGDLNGDGALDIVQGNAGQSYLYLNDRQGGFAARINLGDREQTSSVVVGDLNGDGLLDIVQGNRSDRFNNAGPSYVYLNNGQGAFTQIINLGPASDTRSVAVGDLNGDGWLDIIQGNSDFNKHEGYSYIYLNDGQGGFPQLINLGSAADTRSLAVGDLNGDGWLDIVQGNATYYDNDTLKYRQSVIFLNDGQGRFPDTNHLLGEPTDALSIAVGDLNSDGALDIVQGNGTQSYIYLNDGQGNFSQGIPIGPPTRTNSMIVGDLNGDGALDIIQGNYLRQSYIYLNDGRGNFTQGVPLGHGERTLGQALGDLNGDGALDIVQGNDGSSYIYLNDGRGNFPQSLPLSNKETTHSVAIGDLNGDGTLDIVQGNYLQPQGTVYLNDGHARFTQSIPLGAGQTTESMALGDFNNDGLLDIVQGNTYKDPHTGQFVPVQQSYIYRNGMRQASGLVNQAPQIVVTRPGPTGNANFFSSPAILSSPTIPITYTLFDHENEPVGRVEAAYSLN